MDSWNVWRGGSRCADFDRYFKSSGCAGQSYRRWRYLTGHFFQLPFSHPSSWMWEAPCWWECTGWPWHAEVLVAYFESSCLQCRKMPTCVWAYWRPRATCSNSEDHWGWDTPGCHDSSCFWAGNCSRIWGGSSIGKTRLGWASSFLSWRIKICISRHRIIQSCRPIPVFARLFRVGRSEFRGWTGQHDLLILYYLIWHENLHYRCSWLRFCFRLRRPHGPVSRRTSSWRTGRWFWPTAQSLPLVPFGIPHSKFCCQPFHIPKGYLGVCWFGTILRLSFRGWIGTLLLRGQRKSGDSFSCPGTPSGSRSESGVIFDEAAERNWSWPPGFEIGFVRNSARTSFCGWERRKCLSKSGFASLDQWYKWQTNSSFLPALRSHRHCSRRSSSSRTCKTSPCTGGRRSKFASNRGSFNHVDSTSTPTLPFCWVLRSLGQTSSSRWDCRADSVRSRPHQAQNPTWTETPPPWPFSSSRLDSASSSWWTAGQIPLLAIHIMAQPDKFLEFWLWFGSIAWLG